MKNILIILLITLFSVLSTKSIYAQPEPPIVFLVYNDLNHNQTYDNEDTPVQDVYFEIGYDDILIVARTDPHGMVVLYARDPGQWYFNITENGCAAGSFRSITRSFIVRIIYTSTCTTFIPIVRN